MKDLVDHLLSHADAHDIAVMESPMALSRYLRGAILADHRLDLPLARVTNSLASRFQASTALNAGTLCWLYSSTAREGSATLLSQLEREVAQLLPAAGTNDGYPQRCFFEDLDDWALRAPMYFGAWTVAAVHTTFEGYAAALEFSGYSVTNARRRFLELENYLQKKEGLPGKWHQLLTVLTGRAACIDSLVQLLNQLDNQ